MAKRLTAISIMIAAGSFLIAGTAWAFTRMSDHLSLSWPGAGVDHRIQFRIAESIPAGGRLRIDLGPGFTIPDDFDLLDVDLAVAVSESGPYLERPLGFVADAVSDGVSIATGTGGSVSLELNSTAGLDSGYYVRLLLGAGASFGGNGDSRIINPIATGAAQADLTAFDQFGEEIDHGRVAVFIIEPVAMTLNQPKIRSNGSPSGFLSYGISATIISLTTNYRADCRWSHVGTTSYDVMTDVFSSTGDYFHSSLITGISTGDYTFYVRCRDELGIPDDTDYLIQFTIKAQGTSEEPGTGDGDEGGEGTGGRGGPGSGGGSGGGTGGAVGAGTGDLQPFPPPPSDPSVVLSGWAYLSSPVALLQDGREIARLTSGTDAKFNFPVAELKEGVYTFSITATDKAGRKPPAYSTTFWVKAGTKTQVGNIVLAPTIAVESAAVDIGAPVRAVGSAPPGATVEVVLQPDKDRVADTEIRKTVAAPGPTGEWEAFIDTAGLPAGIYNLKARSILPAGTSEWGQVIKVGVGAQVPAEDACAGSDLNQDGRVNITDFSILLYWWGTDNDCADQNDDGKVDLIDFSIMMFNWTG